MGRGCRIWQPRPWVCSGGYLEGETLDVNHVPKPAEGSVDELQHGQEGNEVGCNVGHKPHGGGSPAASSFQDVLLFPAWKKTPMYSSGWASPTPGQCSLQGCVPITGSPSLGPPTVSNRAPKCPRGFPAVEGHLQPHSTAPPLTLTHWRGGCLLCP